jgi:hypothetical protein
MSAAARQFRACIAIANLSDGAHRASFDQKGLLAFALIPSAERQAARKGTVETFLECTPEDQHWLSTGPGKLHAIERSIHLGLPTETPFEGR